MIDIERELDSCTFVKDYKKLIERLQKEREVTENRLAEAADLMADAGCILNSPHAKRLWIERGY